MIFIFFKLKNYFELPSLHRTKNRAPTSSQENPDLPISKFQNHQNGKVIFSMLKKNRARVARKYIDRSYIHTYLKHKHFRARIWVATHFCSLGYF